MSTPSRALTIRANVRTNADPYIVIGAGNGEKKSYLQAPENSKMNDSYWVVIFDRTNLQTPVVNEVYQAKNNSTIPANFKKYNDKEQYFFFFIANNMSTLHTPQGELFDFLIYNGAGRELRRLEQIHTALGCGSIGHMNYVLTNIFKDSDNSGFEEGDFRNDIIMTLRLLEIEIDGKIWYEPANLEH